MSGTQGATINGGVEDNNLQTQSPNKGEREPEEQTDSKQPKRNDKEHSYDAKYLAQLKKDNEEFEIRLKLKANRIALLKTEEKKNLKILEETREQARIIQKKKEERDEPLGVQKKNRV